MSEKPDPTGRSVADAEDRLAQLGVQVDAMQALLLRLMQDVVRAEARLDDSRAARLVQADEQRVVAALANQAEAEAAAQALKRTPQAAEQDALTQLPNRNLFLDRFAQAVASARRHGTRFALLFLDLDNFKQLNDEHGHVFGDRVLRVVAERMLAAVREVDTVSRHGGDEFLVLLAGLSQIDDARTVAEKLIAAVSAAAELEGQAVRVTASAGIAIYPDDGEDLDTLIARADAAMYETKRRRAGGVAFHGRSVDEDPAWRGQSVRRRRPTASVAAGEAGDAERRLADLREANEKLVLAALSAQELQAAAERAQQRQAAFLAAVADELRDPKAPIRIASSILGRPSADEPLLPRVQSIVERQMTQMARLVGDLVDAANLDGGGLTLDRRPLDLAQVVDRAVAAIQPMMAERGQRFELQRPPGALDVQGDAARLEQVVGNLLDNASRYTQEGGHISLSVEAAADTLTLTVSDNGIGISAQMLPHIFEPFVQDAQALGFSGVGLGIGLTVARALVQAHGGTLAANSAGISRGSRFVVTLPRAGHGEIAEAAGAGSDGASPGQ